MQILQPTSPQRAVLIESAGHRKNLPSWALDSVGRKGREVEIEKMENRNEMNKLC